MVPRVTRLAQSAVICVALLGLAAPAAAQEPPSPSDPDGAVRAPGAVAAGGRLQVAVTGVALPARVEVRRNGIWRAQGQSIDKDGGSWTHRVGARLGVIRVRARGADGAVTRSTGVRVRLLQLAAVGDINLGDGPGQRIGLHGPGYPWTSVGPALREADIAFGNLECAISTRGRAQAKEFVFRGLPSSLVAMRARAGMDVLNLANNHAGDYGDGALLDTLRHIRRNGMVPVGAGATERAAFEPRVVERLGLRVAFVGFSAILPFEFRALGRNPGTAWAFPARVRSAVRRAARRADVVIAAFHWGTERALTEHAGQRALAQVALRAGATAVIGAHPHVLQPIRRPLGRLVAYSLGNFVFSAASPGTQRTGILHVGLARRRVHRVRLRRATIVASRPMLDRPVSRLRRPRP